MDIVKRIEKDMDKLRVIKYQEEDILSDGEFIRLRRGKYYLNNGEVIDRESVVKSVGSGNAACIFAVTQDKKILLVIHPRIVFPTQDKISIEMPAGYIEKGEEPIDAAKRELEEETGYRAKNIIMVDSYYPSLGISGERIDLFLALDCEKVGELHLDDDEYIVNEMVTIDEFKFLIDHHYIKGVNERLGYYHYLEYLEKGLWWREKK